MSQFSVKNEPESSDYFYVTNGDGNRVEGPCSKSKAYAIKDALNLVEYFRETLLNRETSEKQSLLIKEIINTF